VTDQNQQTSLLSSTEQVSDYQSWLVPIFLALILILGGVYRLTGVNWDEDQHLHPDERFLTMVESSLQAEGPAPQGCSKWGSYFSTACSPLNPYNHNYGLFVYGTFPIFLTQFVGDVLSKTDYGNIHLVGRVLSALFDLSTVLLIFFIGKRLYGTRVALLGSLFLAASVLDIQQSHFFTVDTFTNVPILLAFWFALDIADGKNWRAFLWAGIMFGLALAGRINIATFAAILIAAAAFRAFGQANVRGTAADPERNAFTITSTRAFFALAVCALAALVTFRIAQPYAANGPNFASPSLPKFDFSHGGSTVLFDLALSWAGGVNPRFADNMTYVGDLVSGKIDYPPGHQWTDRTAYIFPLQNMVLWGLGLPLGIAAWIGFLVALYRLLRYREWQHLLIVVWVAITFGYSGQQFVKTMRYFLQIYPFLCLLAGYFLVWLWDMAKQSAQQMMGNSRFQSLAFRLAGLLVAVIVIGYTLFWATAFTMIYTRPVSRVTASRWMFANISPGSVIANEHWDDPLPLRVDGKDPFGGMYRGLSSSSDSLMQWYGEDTPEKRVQAIQWVNEAQYIVLSSNRLYASIPRLPMRYPMTTKYYEWLFKGTLDFDLVATFTSRPQLFGIEIADDEAEEIFTVYDHPKVLIFKKNARYNPSKTSALFNSVDLNEVYRFTPLQATQAKTALLLTQQEREVQARGGTWRDIFDPNDFVNRIPVIVWLVMIEILGWLAFPIAYLAFRALVDRGYVFAKALGLLIPAWGAWMLASFHLVPFGRASILLIVGVIALIGIVIVWRRRREIISFVRTNRTVIWTEEILFLFFFALFLAIRFGNPDLWHPNFGGEKPMDFAYLNAIVKSTWFPPYDPWFAGGYMDYYYFGQLITATLVRLSGIVPEVAYNLALPLFFALTAMGAFSVVFNLVARDRGGTSGRQSADREGSLNPSSAFASQKIPLAILCGLFGGTFVAVIGNLAELWLILDSFAKLGANASPNIPGVGFVVSLFVGMSEVLTKGQPFDIPIGWWYWNATRVIPDTINEFPFFTFLYADLHAHLISLPFTLVVMGLAINFVLRDTDDASRLPFLSRLPVAPLDLIEISVAALALGALRAINFADFFPTYVLLVLCALAVGEYGRRRSIDLGGIFAVVWRFVAVFGLTSIFYQPFISHFATAYLSTDLWTDKRTQLGDYLTVHGIFFFAVATFLIAQIFATRHDRGIIRFLRLATTRMSRLDHAMSLQRSLALPTTAYQDFTTVIVTGAIVVEIMFLIVGWGVFALVTPFLVIAGLLVLRPDLEPGRRWVVLLIATALALTLMVEVLTYKGDIGRMNTVFKFYLQVWVFFGIAAAAGIGYIYTRIPKWWWGIFGVLVFTGMLYPVFATRAKVNDRFVAGSPPGLNGMDYMQQAVYHDRDRELPLQYDRNAIAWLRENIAGSPVFLEGNAPLYHWGSRVSVYTGLPTVIGWDWHQKQQRSIIDGAIIDRRIDSVRDIYNTLDLNQALGNLKRFNVQYVYIGDMERAFYDPQGLDKFDAMVRAGMLEVVYQNERVKIYRVKV
jgi:YYY domain-containing protein